MGSLRCQALRALWVPTMLVGTLRVVRSAHLDSQQQTPNQQAWTIVVSACNALHADILIIMTGHSFCFQILDATH